MRFMKFAVLAAILMLPVSAANAGILSSFIQSGPIGSPVLNTIDDNNAEYITKGVGNTAAAFEIGDTLNLFASFDSISTSNGIFNGTALDQANTGGAGYELIAVARLTIDGIGDFDGDADVNDISFNGSFDLYEGFGPTHSLNFTSGIAATEAQLAALAGTELATFGFGDVDDFIIAEDAPVSFGPVVNGQQINAFFGLTQLSGSDLGIVPNSLANSADASFNSTLHDIVGTSTARNFNGPLAPIVLGDDVFDLSTDTEFAFLSQVPEPTGIFLWAGLFGLAASRRRRNAS